jgi:HEAT repeat protein/DNA-binding Xre family transcriptional regulator
VSKLAKVVEIDFETLRRELWGKSAEVAQVLGIAPENLSRKLRGHHKLTLEELNHIALYLQRDVSDFLIFKSDSSDDSREVNMQEERAAILKRLEEGQISLTEAEQMLDGLESETRPVLAGAQPDETDEGALSADEQQALSPADTEELAKAQEIPSRTTALIMALNDEDAAVRREATQALLHVGDEAAIPALAKVLNTDAEKEVRRGAAHTLRHIGDTTAIPALAKALADEDAAVRREAAQALRHIGDTTAIPALTEALEHDEDAAVRRGVVDALRHIGGEASGAALIKALNDPDASVRRQAVSALGRIDADSRRKRKDKRKWKRRDPGASSTNQLIQMKIYGVDGDFIKTMAAHGLENLTPDQLVQLKIHGVSPDFVGAMRELGFEHLTPEQLSQLSIHDVDADFVRAMAESGFEHLTAEQLVQMKIADVNPELVEAIKGLGFEHLTPEQVAEMGLHGVTPDFIKEMGAQGFEELTPEQLVEMKIHE